MDIGTQENAWWIQSGWSCIFAMLCLSHLASLRMLFVYLADALIQGDLHNFHIYILSIHMAGYLRKQFRLMYFVQESEDEQFLARSQTCRVWATTIVPNS